MKVLNTIVKLLTVLAAVAGAVYIIATYGEQIVAWAKVIWEKVPKECPCCCKKAEPVEEAVEDPAPAKEAPAEAPAPEVVVAEHEPVAEEADFVE